MKLFILISIAYDSAKNRIVTKSVRGIFTELALAKASVTKFAHSISEGNYFNYILIEERDADVIDVHSENELWYQFKTTPGDNILVEEISKPQPFRYYVNFV